jgi:hypothetical protein
MSTLKISRIPRRSLVAANQTASFLAADATKSGFGSPAILHVPRQS